MRKILHLAAFLVMLLGLFPAAPGEAAPSEAPVRLRIGVTTDGIVRVTPADLSAAGLNPGQIDPRTFAMSSLGKPVAIAVSGEADGRFDSGDSILFFGQRFRGPEMDQKYTDERVYWLDFDGPNGLRITETDATPHGDLTPPTDFAATLHVEPSNYWYTLHSLSLDTQDTWFWESIRVTTPGQTVTRALAVPVPDPVLDAASTLRLELMDRPPQGYISQSHHTVAGVNGLQLADETWMGHARKVLTLNVPANRLINGVNTVSVSEIRPAGSTLEDWIYANFVELDYRRQFRAAQGQLDFIAEQAGPQEYAVAGWANAQTAVWDISDPLQPKRLIGAAATAVGAETQLRFRATAQAGARYWLQAESTFAAPASVRVRQPTGLRTPAEGADAVIVTPASLRPAAERLAEWHRAHGRRAQVVDIQAVYDEFNDGIYHPKAVPAMLAWAQTKWPGPAPLYLTLVGDGHWNFKGYNPSVYPDSPNLIPPYLDWVDTVQGETPSDTAFGDLDGDRLPEIAVGRLAVNTLAEAQAVVDKIITYDESARVEAWQKRAVFIADDTDSAGDFQALTDEIIAEKLPADLAPQRIYLGQNYPDAVTARAALVAALNSGAWMVQYTGHGGINFWARWGADTLWRTQDITGLSSPGRLPVVMTFNCLDGYFAYPGSPSIAELMQRQPAGGSVAAISPSGLGYTYDQHIFRSILMDVLFQDQVREIGRALLLTKQRYDTTYSHGNPNLGYLIGSMMLYGDPAMRLPVGSIRHYLPVALMGPG